MAMTEMNRNNGVFAWKGHQYLALACRLFIGGIFIAACIFKIKDPEVFALSIATYDILPTSLVNLMAIILPWLELVVGVMIIIGYKTRPSALLIALMMLMFMTALAIALARGIDMSCGCFASAEAGEQISRLTMLRDLCYLLPAIYVLLFDSNPIGAGRLRRVQEGKRSI
jgi:putative oxidoreductase